MKKNKIALLLSLSLFATAAYSEGEYASIRFEARDGIQGTQDSQAYGFTLGQNLTKNWAAEFSGRLKDNTDDTNNTRLEVGLVGKLPIDNSNFSLYNRVAVGKKFDGEDSNGYWSVEPGVKYSITTNLSAKAGVRLREGFTADVKDSTKTYRVGLEYAFTKNSSLITGVDFQRGDSDSNNYMIGYSVKF